MTSEELRSALASLEWSVTDAAWYLGVSRRSLNYWLSGYSFVPLAVTLLIDLAVTVPDAKKRLMGRLV